MQHFIDHILDVYGAPIKSATVQVNLNSDGSAATIYSDNSSTVKTNPLTTDELGQFDFYAADGRYNLVISAPGITTRTVADIILEDQLDVSSGTATILSGNTSIVVTHGLTGTPTIDDINVVMAENPTNDPGNIWIDTITATQFTINCRTDPGASNLDFGWNATVR